MLKKISTPEIIKDAAKRCGYSVGQIDSPYSDAIYVTDGKRQFITHKKTTFGAYPTNTKFAEVLADDKATTKRVLKKFGFRIIKGKQFYLVTPEEATLLEKDRAMSACAYARKIGYPVFVKPNSGSQGANARIIFNETGLKTHIKKMRKDDIASFLVEKFTERPEYRIFVVGGKPQFMYRKKRVSVTGTGEHTIAELIAQLQESPDHEVVKKMLRKEGKNHNSILPAKTELTLQETANISMGAKITEYRDSFPKVMHDWATELYKVTGLDVYGVDVFTKGDWNDPSKYLIIEVNSNASLMGIYKAGHMKKAAAICELIMKRFFNSK